MGNPYPLKQNAGKSFQGSIVLGKGFVLTPEEAERLINKNPRNREVLFPYLNGDDLNNDPQQKPSRWVINFFDWPEERAQQYPDCFEIIERLVKPERQRWKQDESGKEIIGTYALRKPLPQKWWIYGEKRPALYETISQLDQVMAIALTSKYVSISKVPSNMVFSHSLGIFAYDSYLFFSILQSTLHEQWAWKYASTLESRIRYTPSVCFETFPLPYNLADTQKNTVMDIGRQYDMSRKLIMQNLGIGLTKLYNSFHDGNCKDSQIIDLRNLHSKLDCVILELYGWTDLVPTYDFYQMDFLPENDRIRYAMNLQVRQEILKRLLKLNEMLHTEETNLVPTGPPSVKRKQIANGNLFA